MTFSELWLRLLAVWAVVAFSHPGLIPVQAAVAGGATLIVLVLCGHANTAWRAPPPLTVLLVVLAFASPMWAEVWGGFGWQLGSKWAFGLAWAAFYAVVTVAAAVFAFCTTPSQGLRYMDGALKTLVVATVVMIVATPGEAYDQRMPNVGTLTGLFTHKNILGPVLILGLITCLYVNRGRPIRRWAWAAAYLALLLQVKSASALVLAVAMVALFLLMRAWPADMKIRSQIMFVSALPVVAAVWLLISSQSQLLSLLGRDETLSGRDDIWAGTLAAWQDHPLLGYGWYITYTEASPAAMLIRQHTGWWVPSSHNGYLTMMLSLGVIGAAVLLAFVSVTLVKMFSTTVRDTRPEARWALQVVLTFVLINLSDAHLDSTAWFLLVAVATWLRIGWPEPEPESGGLEADPGRRVGGRVVPHRGRKVPQRP